MLIRAVKEGRYTEIIFFNNKPAKGGYKEPNKYPYKLR